MIVFGFEGEFVWGNMDFRVLVLMEGSLGVVIGVGDIGDCVVFFRYGGFGWVRGGSGVVLYVC